MSKMRGAQALIKALEAQDVRYVFGLPGHGNMNILDAIYDSDKIRFLLVRHEQAAVHIAMATRVSVEKWACVARRLALVPPI